MSKQRAVYSIGLLASALCLGCQTAYYGAMESVGIHKREIMVDRVKGARDAQSTPDYSTLPLRLLTVDTARGRLSAESAAV